jgi:hypothetical protein
MADQDDRLWHSPVTERMRINLKQSSKAESGAIPIDHAPQSRWQIMIPGIMAYPRLRLSGMGLKYATVPRPVKGVVLSPGRHVPVSRFYRDFLFNGPGRDSSSLASLSCRSPASRMGPGPGFSDSECAPQPGP